MKKVACVGILVADVMTKPVDEVPEKGLLSQVDAIELYSGGNAMTAAVNMRKMGVESYIVGKVGEDMFGTFLQQKMQEHAMLFMMWMKGDISTSISAQPVRRVPTRMFGACSRLMLKRKVLVCTRTILLPISSM